ncbi:MAG TPA: exopolysaccharide biosynthesis polyprenyl glycosylphosphotransferase [Planctomycetota bacterium]|nr:exopolysaccharide biosynthesis polyprenyl glycosylphosphotransferase [Planctomycetota bacterium]
MSVDALAVMASVLLAAALIEPGTPATAGFLPYVAAYASAVCGVVAWLRLYPGVMLDPVDEARRLTIGTGIAAAVTFVALLLLADVDIGLGFACATWGISAVAINLARWGARYWLGGRRWWGIPVTVVGEPAAAQKVVELMHRNPRQGLRPVEAAPSTPILSRQSTVQPWVVMATSCQLTDEDAFDWAVRLGARNLFIVDPERRELADRLARSLPSRSFSAIQVSPKLYRRGSLNAKRLFDIGCVSLLLLMLAPLFLAVAVAVRLSSKGPVFFGHNRIGRGGRHFRAFKFRTMHVGDQILRDHLAANPAAAAEWAATQKLKDDPRVTRVGAFLRRTSIDELPQLWNVLRGDMSLVGPRPIVDDEAEKYGQVLALYLRVTPGITGLWQISGRNNTSYEQRVWLDAHYVRNWSLTLDLYILARTVGVVVRRDGAY